MKKLIDQSAEALKAQLGFEKLKPGEKIIVTVIGSGCAGKEALFPMLSDAERELIIIEDANDVIQKKRSAGLTEIGPPPTPYKFTRNVEELKRIEYETYAERDDGNPHHGPRKSRKGSNKKIKKHKKAKNGRQKRRKK